MGIRLCAIAITSVFGSLSLLGGCSAVAPIQSVNATSPSNQGNTTAVQQTGTTTAAPTIAPLGTITQSSSHLQSARLGHTTTLLPDGRLLIAGGGYGPDLIDGYWVVDQAELYDPATDSFTAAGSVSRDFHTATLLNTGDVLLAGGEVGWTTSLPYVPILPNSAELEKPNTTYVPTGSMYSARESHTATLLKDGRVLIVGGVVPAGLGWTALNSAEIYDPSTNSFSGVGDMKVARTYHTATLLPDGKVLITGGGYPGGGQTAEVFDPGTSSFTQVGNMSIVRSGHTATLLSSGKVLVVGGQVSGATVADLYDPATGSFTATATDSIPRTWHTATLLGNGTVLLAGGYGDHGADAMTTEIYDPASESFKPGPNLQTPRFMHTATLLPDGRVALIGGASTSDGVHLAVLASVEFYR
jgi:hypothetical protein